MDPARSLLRHTLATLAYRAAKVLRGAPEGFAAVRAGETTRPAGVTLAHVGDLLDWALGMADGVYAWNDATPQPWDAEVARFFAALRAFDDRLADPAPLVGTPEILFQGPIADALTHVGQLATLRRLAGSPVKGESYARAEIVAGRVGPDQDGPRVEFD